MVQKINNGSAGIAGLWVSMLLSAILPMMLGFVLAESFSDWRWNHYPFHSFVESIGALSALIIATLMIVMLRHERLSRRYIMVACALIGMGLLDGFHAVLHVGASFVWLHSIATLVGGILFATVWLPEAWLAEKRQPLLLVATVSISLLAGIVSTAMPDILPAMVIDGQFSLLAKIINISGGIGFLIGSSYFIYDYWRRQETQSGERKLTEDMVFANHCLLFGIAGLLFELSVLWDAGWWWWHILRLLAYLVVLVYFFILFKKAQDQLVEGEAKYRLINSRLPGIVYQFKVDVNGKRSLPYVSPTIETYLGLSAKTAMEDVEKWFALIHPDDLPGLESSIIESMDNITVWEWEGRFICNGSDEFWVHGSSTPLNLEDGRIVWDGIFVDINERVKASKALRKNEEELDRIFNLSPDIVGYGTLDGHFTKVNDALYSILGYTREEFLNKSFLEFVHPNDKPATLAALQKALEGTSNILIENRYQCKDGSYKWISWSVVSDKNKNEFIATGRDVTESKQFRRALYDQAEIIDQIHDSVISSDIDGFITSWNKGSEKLLGYTREEVLGKHVSVFYPEDEHGFLLNEVIAPLQEKGEHETEVRMRRKSGENFYAHLSLTMIYDERGKASGMIGFAMDITERKEAEYELNEEKNKVQYYLDIVAVMLVVLNDKGEVIMINKKGCDILGFNEAEVLGKNWFDNFIPEGDSRKVKEVFGLLMKGEVEPVDTYENIVLTNGRKEKLIKWNNIVFCDVEGNNIGTLSSGEDVTEKKQAELALQEAYILNNRIIEESPIGIAIYDQSGQCIVANSSLANMVGATQDKLLTLNYKDLESWKKSGLLEAANRAVSLQQKERHEFDVVTTFGKQASLDCAFVPFNLSGKQHLLLMVDDVTNRKETERLLKDSEERLMSFMDSATDGFVIFDENFIFQEINETAQSKFRMNREDVLGKHILEVYPVIEGNGRYEEYLRVIKTGEPYFVEDIPTTPEAGSLSISVKAFKVGTGLGMILSDITEIKQAEAELSKHRHHLEELIEERTKELHNAQDELVRKERLATLGQLTATVSHELRNPLGAMRPSVYILNKLTDKNNDRVKKALGIVDRNIDRCDHIIDELLDFTRITDLERHPTRVDEWLASIIDEQNIPEDIRLEKNLSLNDLELGLDTDRLQRAIINVMENACHAMLEDIEAGMHREGACLGINTMTNGQRVEITISDNGVGIKDDVMEKMFEPLFSTKTFGVGLGMPTVRQIMKQHGGGIEIDSEESKGTSVILWLPVTVENGVRV